jgi:hypothetical protein
VDSLFVVDDSCVFWNNIGTLKLNRIWWLLFDFTLKKKKKERKVHFSQFHQQEAHTHITE